MAHSPKTVSLKARQHSPARGIDLVLFEYLDRDNVGNAKLYGLDTGHQTEDQGVGPGTRSLTSPQWQLVVIIFYVRLVLFQVPGCIGYRIFSPSKVGNAAFQTYTQLMKPKVGSIWCLWMGRIEPPSMRCVQLCRRTCLQSLPRRFRRPLWNGNYILPFPLVSPN